MVLTCREIASLAMRIMVVWQLDLTPPDDMNKDQLEIYADASTYPQVGLSIKQERLIDGFGAKWFEICNDKSTSTYSK